MEILFWFLYYEDKIENIKNSLNIKVASRFRKELPREAHPWEAHFED